MGRPRSERGENRFTGGRRGHPLDGAGLPGDSGRRGPAISPGQGLGRCVTKTGPLRRTLYATAQIIAEKARVGQTIRIMHGLKQLGTYGGRGTGDDREEDAMFDQGGIRPVTGRSPHKRACPLRPERLEVTRRSEMIETALQLHRVHGIAGREGGAVVCGTHAVMNRLTSVALGVPGRRRMDIPRGRGSWNGLRAVGQGGDRPGDDPTIFLDPRRGAREDRGPQRGWGPSLRADPRPASGRNGPSAHDDHRLGKEAGGVAARGTVTGFTVIFPQSRSCRWTPAKAGPGNWAWAQPYRARRWENKLGFNSGN